MVEKARNRGFVFNDNKRGDKRGGKDKQEQQEAKLRYSCSHHTEMRSQKKKDLSILIFVSLPLMKKVVAL